VNLHCCELPFLPFDFASDADHRGQNLSTYEDQTDVLYKNPLSYLYRFFPEKVDLLFPPSPKPFTLPGSAPTAVETWDHRWPSHLIFFGALLEHDGVETLLKRKGYREAWAARGSWEEDWRRRGGVKVWKWRP